MEAFIRSSWTKGIDVARPCRMGYEIRLNGHPWGYHGHVSDSVRLTRELLASLYDIGWVLQAAVDMCKLRSGKGTSVLNVEDFAANDFQTRYYYDDMIHLHQSACG